MKKTRLRKTFMVLLLLACCMAQPAAAHPHAFIDMRTVLLTNDKNELTGLTEHWVFDQFYTEFFLHEITNKKDGSIDRAKLLTLVQEMLKRLSAANYFVFFQGQDHGNGTNKGKPPAPLFKPVKSYDAYLENKHIAIDFTLELDQPLSARKQTIALKIYDPSYYTAMQHVQAFNALHVEGDGRCTGRLIRTKPDAMWQELAAAIDRNAKAPDDLGTYFADKITLTCGE